MTRGTSRHTARTAPRTAALAAALALAVAAAGCTDDRPAQPRVTTQTQFLEGLSNAIGGVNRTRAAIARDAGVISAAAAAIDAVDDAAVDGDREAVRARRPAADKAVARARPVTNRLGRDVRAYGRAVDALDEAPDEGLDPAQRTALADVVRAARAELVRLQGYATVIASIWGRYERLNEAQQLWLARASGGWYRDRREAAGNYVLLTDRESLARDRRSLVGADRRRLAAAREVDAEMTRARAALASLLG